MADSSIAQKGICATVARASIDPTSFQAAVFGWYDGSRRRLPWRALPGGVADPYRVWLSEIMLQQTTIAAVIPYFKKFTALWPTLSDLGAAPRDEVMTAWAGLGYYSRARNLHACAQVLAQTGFPRTSSELLKLPGIGPYTAAAVAAIAFGEAAAVVDGNVERVVSRLFAIETPMPAAKRIIRDQAAALTPDARPGDYAQAMMDLGATVCTPRSPICLTCPVRVFCAAARQGNPTRYPIKAAKAERPVRYGTALILVRNGACGPSVCLRQRPDKGLLGGMMEPVCTPFITNADDSPLHEDFTEACACFDNLDALDTAEAETVQHTFTHFHLTLKVRAAWVAPAAVVNQPGATWAPVSELDRFSLPTVMRKAVNSGLDAIGVINDNTSGV